MNQDRPDSQAPPQADPHSKPETEQHSQTTHFGFQEVPKAEKARRVGAVFSSVARNYDVMNDLMSMGVHRVWKRFTIDLAGVRPGEQVLDLAGGTGDLARAFVRQIGGSGQVVLADINAEMLTEGRRRLQDEGFVSGVRFVQANAECLPFSEGTMDCITIAFGLRNVTDKDAALASMYRCLKPGGRLLVLEFSKPLSEGFSKLYDAYSFSVLPLLGRFVARDEAAYRYLAESIRRHPDQDTLKAMMEAAGFERVQVYNLTGGVVALHRGYRL